MATGGSTNHTIHWIAVARAAGIVLTWDDFDELSQLIPLLARVYPNGEADVNRFAAGGPAFVFGELIKAGLMHGDLVSVARGGMADYAREPQLRDGQLVYLPGLERSADDEVVRGVDNPFEHQGGLRLLRGNLGKSLIKLSAVKPQYRTIEAPAVVVDAPQVLTSCMPVAAAGLRGGGALPGAARQRHAGAAFAGAATGAAAEPGPARGAGHRRPPVRRSGKIPAAIHVTPEAARGGPLAKVREGDMIRLDGEAGTLEVLVDAAEWAARHWRRTPHRRHMTWAAICSRSTGAWWGRPTRARFRFRAVRRRPMAGRGNTTRSTSWGTMPQRRRRRMRQKTPEGWRALRACVGGKCPG